MARLGDIVTGVAGIAGRHRLRHGLRHGCVMACVRGLVTGFFAGFITVSGDEDGGGGRFVPPFGESKGYFSGW
ncbi:hypothetical protein POF50_024680 [Streptomyces sp. SL13]|uniref:Uncharacterized protein n=1 Tax=Streptantibioticus silvisoli TaxID=2705255 RepID=A0AA90H8Q4_9ACTN|nr:hypothetical protein [Streptantibioticus silvisoli]MDI5972497.1 hypothetical protein [Streptantibioticus silvisoli]